MSLVKKKLKRISQILFHIREQQKFVCGIKSEEVIKREIRKKSKAERSLRKEGLSQAREFSAGFNKVNNLFNL